MKCVQPLLLLGSTIVAALVSTANGFYASTMSIPTSTRIARKTSHLAKTELTSVTWFRGSRSCTIATTRRMPEGLGPLRARLRRSSDEGTNDDDDYLKRLQEAARDPVAFEKFVMAKDKVVDHDDDEIETNPQGVDNNSAVNPNKKKGYQRIEEWDAQRTKDDMSWEERVQFEGRRFGNQYLQNEILRRNLKSF
jgi:hypothetical protein